VDLENRAHVKWFYGSFYSFTGKKAHGFRKTPSPKPLMEEEHHTRAADDDHVAIDPAYFRS
jgi:hypothetical protein